MVFESLILLLTVVLFSVHDGNRWPVCPKLSAAVDTSKTCRKSHIAEVCAILRNMGKPGAKITETVRHTQHFRKKHSENRRSVYHMQDWSSAFRRMPRYMKYSRLLAKIFNQYTKRWRLSLRQVLVVPAMCKPRRFNPPTIESETIKNMILREKGWVWKPSIQYAIIASFAQQFHYRTVV